MGSVLCRVAAIAAGLALGGVGCSSDPLTQSTVDQAPPLDASGAAPDLSPPVLVEIDGTRGTHWVGAGGEDQQDYNLSGTVIEALIPDGKGGFASVSGAGQPGGVFHIFDVPAGRNYVHYSDWGYFVTSGTTLDLGDVRIGNRNKKFVTVTPTTLVFNVTGLDPWSSADGTQLYDGGVGASMFCIQCNALNGPLPGDTALTDLQVDYSAAGNAVLFDSLPSDAPQLLQTIGRKSARGYAYLAIGKLATFAPFTLADGGKGTLTGSLVDVPQTLHASPVWKRSAFEALRTVVNPRARSSSENLRIAARPVPMAYGDVYPQVDLFYAGGTSPLDVDFGEVTYGNPFGASWSVFGSADAAFSMKYTLPATRALTAYASTWYSDELTRFLQQPAAPLLTPVQGLTINGQNGYNDLGIRQPVQVGWKAPATGTPGGYTVVIYHLVNMAGATARQYLAEIHTTDTSAWIPPGLLVAGESYYLELIATSAGGVDLEVHPFRRDLPYAQADALSGMLTLLK
jgi:hypothetical protein